MLKLFDAFVAFGREVEVRVHDRGHDGLAGEVHALRAIRHFDPPARPDADELSILDEEDGGRDDGAVSREDRGALERRHAGGVLTPIRRASGHQCGGDREAGETNGWDRCDHMGAKHVYLLSGSCGTP